MPVSLELRTAARTLRQHPLFTFVATISLAVGIGGSTTVFSVVNALLLRPPEGVAAPERVVEIGRTNGGSGFDTFSLPELRDIQSHGAFSHVSGVRVAPVSLGTDEGGERIVAFTVSAPYFGAMGGRPSLGRFFLPEEDVVPGAHPVVVVSYRFWTDRLGARPDALGTTVMLNRRAFTVVGVTAADFHGHIPSMRPDAYVPIAMMGVIRPGFDGFDARFGSAIQMVGRLADGVTLEQANAGLATLFANLAATYPDVYVDQQRSARAERIGPVPGGGRTFVAAFLGLLGGLTGLVLLITCANVAGMMLARGVAREREIAIRLSLGAGRARVVRQLVLESVMLFLLAGAAGVLLAFWGTDVLSSAALPAPVPIVLDLRPDARVLGYGLGVALLAGVLFGLAPALHAARADLAGAMRNQSSHSRSGRMRRFFVTAQVAFSLVLLVASGLFLRSMQQAASVPTGFDGDNVQMVSFDLAMDGYDVASGTQFVEAMLERLRALPGVDDAGVATDLPLDMSLRETGTFPEGWANGPAARPLGTAFNTASDGYFEALRVPVRRGRTFRPTDGSDAPFVVVVTRAYAERAWPGEDPLGRTLSISHPDSAAYTVIGVVDDVKDQSLMEAPRAAVWLPLPQRYAPDLSLVVRARPGVAGPAEIRAAVHEIDPRITLSGFQPLDAVTSLGTMPQRLAAWITTLLGVLALLLCALGVYGVVAHMVARRTREIGIRIAVGARGGDVVRLVVASTLRLVAPGVVLGGISAIAGAHLVRAFLLGVSPLDAVTFGVVTLALLALVAVASAAPARRAARLQPLTALRMD